MIIGGDFNQVWDSMLDVLYECVIGYVQGAGSSRYLVSR